MAKFVTRAGDWQCLCGATNFATEGNCANCDSPQAKGTILNPLNMRCRRKRKSKCVKDPIAIKEINGTILQRLRAWTVLNPFGKNVHMDMGTNNWISMLLKAAHKGNGVHIHTTCSKWMFFELNLGTHHTRGSKYLALSNKLRHTLQTVAAQCLEKALDDVAKYTNCDRVICETGAMWKLPCGNAHEICSLIFQPHGSERQAVHKDGHARYAKPDYPNDVLSNYFLNVIVPMQGDIPTLCRGPNRRLGACAPCDKNEIRIFNGGVWHAGDANNTGKGVWKLFLGLVPHDNPKAGETPVFEDGAGKSLAKFKDRLILISSER